MICTGCCCDASELDDLLIDWEAKSKVMHRAIAVRESVIARLTLAQIPTTRIVRTESSTAMRQSITPSGPSGL